MKLVDITHRPARPHLATGRCRSGARERRRRASCRGVAGSNSRLVVAGRRTPMWINDRAHVLVDGFFEQPSVPDQGEPTVRTNNAVDLRQGRGYVEPVERLADRDHVDAVRAKWDVLCRAAERDCVGEVDEETSHSIDWLHGDNVRTGRDQPARQLLGPSCGRRRLLSQSVPHGRRATRWPSAGTKGVPARTPQRLDRNRTPQPDGPSRPRFASVDARR